jgi:hypothetical protein
MKTPAMADNEKPGPVLTADEQARQLREDGDGEIVYSEVGQADEQADVSQPEAS